FWDSSVKLCLVEPTFWRTSVIFSPGVPTSTVASKLNTPLSLSSFRVNVDFPAMSSVPLLFAVLPSMVMVAGADVLSDGDAEEGGDVGPFAEFDLLHAAPASARADINTTAFNGSDLIGTSRSF